MYYVPKFILSRFNSMTWGRRPSSLQAVAGEEDDVLSQAEAAEDEGFSPLSFPVLMEAEALAGEANAAAVILPRHHRCAAHTLNLIASADLQKIIHSLPQDLEEAETSLKEEDIGLKCALDTARQLWNKFSRSPGVNKNICNLNNVLCYAIAMQSDQRLSPSHPCGLPALACPSSSPMCCISIIACVICIVCAMMIDIGLIIN